MRPIAIFVALMLMVPAARATEAEHRVLFIGNSLTYVNDLPNAFASLATKGGQVEVDMIARGGASLDDAAHDPKVVKAIGDGHYTDIVLQERGGEAFCPATCQKDSGFELPAQRAAAILARMAKASGARVFYLGTWQTNRETNLALELGESRIARSIDATYVQIAEPRRLLMEARPSLAWTHVDGQHPGYATTAMMALRVWRAVFGKPAMAIPCVAGTVHYHAPKPEGVLHVDTSLEPKTCLVSMDVLPALVGER